MKKTQEQTIKELKAKLKERERLLRRIFVAFDQWSWTEDELPYQPMLELEEMFDKRFK